jgi:hypothetical protein
MSLAPAADPAGRELEFPAAGGPPEGQRLRATLWHAFRHELLYVMWAMMEVALIAPFSLAFMPWARYWSPGVFTLWLLLLMFLPFNLGRLMSLLEIPVKRQQIVNVVAMIITLLLSWRMMLYRPDWLLDLGWLGEMLSHAGLPGNPLWTREVTIFIVVILMWWRGLSLIGRSLDIGDIGLRFRVGALISAPLVAGIAGSQLPWPVAPFILLYLMSSLVAIALTRVEQLERSRSGYSFPMGPRWIVVVTAAAGLVVFVTGLIAGLLSGDSLTGVLGFLAPLWLAIQFTTNTALVVISFLSVPIIVVFRWLFELIFGLVGPLFEGAGEVLEPILPGVEMLPPEELQELAPPPTLFDPRQILTILIMLFLVLLVSLAVSRIFRLMRGPALAEGELIEPALGGLPRMGLGRRLLGRLGLLQRWRSAATVRRIYQAMCYLAADYGFPRLETETPYEYLATLNQAWPENGRESRLITDAYNRVRYGEIPETKAELDEIEAAWRVLAKVKPAEIPVAKEAIDLRKRL